MKRKYKNMDVFENNNTNYKNIIKMSKNELKLK